MEKSFISGVISLVKSALTGEKAVLPDDFDFTAAYKLAKAHGIIALLYYGIADSGIPLDEKLNQKFLAGILQGIAVCQEQMEELAALSAKFEENGIDFMPLKGSVIRSLYPKPELRSMGDADILIRTEQYEQIVPILGESGFAFVKESTNELCWNKSPFYLELHRYLVSPRHKDYFEALGDGWQLAKPAEGSRHRYVMSDEDFFVFLFVHFAKHYRSSGIGIKHMTDIWVYLKAKPELDGDYIAQKLEQLHLLRFCENVCKTVDAWFENAEFDDITYLITEKIFSSGAFGTKETTMQGNALRDMQEGKVKNARGNRLLAALFPPYPNMCILYPVLKKAPILLPFLWVYRGIYTVFCKKSAISAQYRSINSLSTERLSKYEEDLHTVGLDYNFKE